MSIQMQLKRGTTAQNLNFVGAESELTVDTQTHELRIHDGVTIGGHKIPTETIVDDKIYLEKNKNITDCITEIPQDIKLELNNGTLTLKAGSKVYVPNGADVFDKVLMQNDITLGGYQNLQGMIFVTTSGTPYFTSLPQIYSGASGTLSSGNVWYDTTTNKIFRSSDGSSWDIQVGFPICIVTSSSGAIASVDQVFNGFGYIGSTVFLLPGVKGLIPNGLNADGSLKNIATEVTSVQTFTYTDNNNTGIYAGITSSGTIKLNGQRNYNEAENFIYNGAGLELVCEFAVYTNPSGKIANFTPKTTFHAVGYNDTEYMAHQAMPSDRHIDLTLGASGSTYTALADGYVYFYMSQPNPHDLQVYLSNETAKVKVRTYQNTNDLACWIPVSKGDTFRLEYTYNSGSYEFRFIYANGAA